MKKSIWPVFLLSFVAFTLGGSELYKWVDEDGVVHFSDQPPQDRQSMVLDVEEFDQTADSTQKESVYSEVIRQQQARRELRAKQKEREAQEKNAEQEEIARSDANCARAIHYLNTLQRQCPVFYDGAGIMRAQCPGYYYSFEGDRTYIEDDEREELIEHYSSIVENCSESYR